MEYSFAQLSNIAKSLREQYPIGSRIKLISMGEDSRPIPSGTKGTVEGVDDMATVHCRFDNGRSLGLCYGEDAYISEILRDMHDTFVDVYDTDTVSHNYGFVEVPAIIECERTGAFYPGLVQLDMESSGEHFGTTVITPIGIINQGNDENTDEENEFMKSLIPYRYWYTPTCEGDIHVDMADCPERIWNIICEATEQSYEQNGGMSL